MITAVGTPTAPHCSTTATTDSARNGDDGEVGHRVELIEPTYRVDPADGGSRRMDHADLARERLQQVSENPPAGGRLVAAGADDDDVLGFDERPQRADCGLPVALISVVLQEVVCGQVELNAHGSLVQPAAVRESDGAEHLLHRRVVGECLRDEAAKPGGLGDHRQILEQDRGDALVVVGVGNGEGDLGLLTGRQGVVLADADDLVLELGEECDVPVEVVDRGAFQLVVRDERSPAEEAKMPRDGLEPVVEGPQALNVGRAGRTDANRSSRRQQHVPLERGEQ